MSISKYTIILYLVILFICLQQKSGEALKNKLMLKNASLCTCPGDTLSYECMVIGSRLDATVWHGSAFDCASGEIILLHSLYSQSTASHAYGECNNGSVVAQSLRIENNVCYTSQLNITISADLIGKCIECAYDDASTITSKSIGAINIITDSQLPSPNTIYASLVDTHSRQITFTWSPIAPGCSTIHYNILASNCGSCPTTTNLTTVTCTDVPVIADNTIACTFALHAINCGIVIGKLSDPIIVLFKEISTMMTNNSTLSTHSTNDNTKLNHSYTAVLALACLFAIGLLISLAAFVTLTVFVFRSKVAKQQNTVTVTHEQATSAATEIPESDYEIIMQSLEQINTNENVAYRPVVK